MAEFFVVLSATFVVLVIVAIVLLIVKAIMFICRPNEVLIFSGRRHEINGQSVGFRVVLGGRAYRVPLLENVDRMDLTNMEVEVKINNAYSKGGIPLNVEAIANVKISDDPTVIGNAIERFLGRPRDEIRSVAKQTLEGHLRGVISTLTPEQMNSDRIQFAQSLADEAEHDLRKLGLHLDTFNIHHVTDNVNYLQSLGRSVIAKVVREAEIAESDAQREAAQQEAKAQAEASVAQQRSEQAVTARANEVRRTRAELEAAAKSVEERAKAAAETARATAEQELQKVRAELEGKRLSADVVARAEADNTAKAILARGAAAPVAERGKATAASLDLMNQAWLEAGDGANAILLIQQLETVLRQIIERLDTVRVGSVNLIDPGDGSSLPNYIASYPAAVGKILRELRDTIGIDVAGTLAASGDGRNGEGA
ncbi:MAG: flotillin family protein [Planctomycetota bacterium]